jgi:hypothetical protein
MYVRRLAIVLPALLLAACARAPNATADMPEPVNAAVAQCQALQQARITPASGHGDALVTCMMQAGYLFQASDRCRQGDPSGEGDPQCYKPRTEY